jgi:hypothetical protein
MPKSPPLISEVQQRAKLRLSEQRRLEHARDTLYSLIDKHFDPQRAEREASELYKLTKLLEHAIKNQHIKDANYAEYKRTEVGSGF